MNIFMREIRANLKSLFIWGAIVVVFQYIAIMKFAAYEGNPQILEVLNSMPPALLTAFQFNAFNLTTITGFYGAMFAYFALMTAISAAMWGSDIISKEERDKTVEFALTLPVTRGKLITGKIAAAFVNCICLLAILWGISLINAAKYKPDDTFYTFLSLCMLALFIIQMVFLAVGIFLGCAMKQYKRSGSIAVSIILVTYFFSVISGLSENLEFLKYFSPFKYFDPVKLMNESRIDVIYVLLSLAIIIVSIIGGYVTYTRRDLYI
jgi:ABC-2 type transport system permease protein